MQENTLNPNTQILNHNLSKIKHTMGAILRILSSLSELKAKVLLLGLDAAGKTTILYKLKLNQTVNSVPTIDFNVQQVKYKNLDFTVWDIGGQTRLQGLWHHYFDSSNAVIYVLDSSDLQRIEEARKTMMNVIDNPTLQDVPLLVFANKMDVTTLKPHEILEKMGLHQLRRNWHLQSCCALNGEGLIEGFDWLSKELSKRKK